MRKAVIGIATVFLASIVSLPAFGADPSTEDQKAFYALGLALSKSIGMFSLSESELELVKAGLTDGVLKHKPKAELKAYEQKLQQLAQTRSAQMADVEKKAGAAYVTKAAAESGAVKTDSGAIVKTMKPGKGPSPKATDRVKVHYHGTLLDGTVFDSSRQRGEPVVFPLNQVVKCWTEGVQKMKVGETARLVCPSDLAYGDRGAPPDIKPGATLVFEVELLDIVKEQDKDKPQKP
jgi:FKBP-type peptidyl-prolyl cis-trans isomerase FkpA